MNQSSALLMAVAVISLAGVKVPEGVSPFLFYGSAAGAAALIFAIVIACIKWPVARYSLGYFTVASLLVLACYTVATLPPYVPQ